MGMGPAFGMQSQSYRARGYGMASFFLRFLIRMTELVGRIAPWMGVICTVSQSELDTVTGIAATRWRQEWQCLQEPTIIEGENVFLLDPLSADWESWIEIQHALSTLLPDIQLQYGKGPQDRMTAVAICNYWRNLMPTRMRWRRRTNLDTYGNERPAVFLMTPRTHTHLQFVSGTITSRYQTAFRSCEL